MVGWAITWRRITRRLRTNEPVEPARGRPPQAAARRAGLDAVTVAALREHQARQAAERATVGAGWQDTGLVFTRPDGPDPPGPDL